jgi:hypothetical protein
MCEIVNWVILVTVNIDVLDHAKGERTMMRYVLSMLDLSPLRHSGQIQGPKLSRLGDHPGLIHQF